MMAPSNTPTPCRTSSSTYSRSDLDEKADGTEVKTSKQITNTKSGRLDDDCPFEDAIFRWMAGN